MLFSKFTGTSPLTGIIAGGTSYAVTDRGHNFWICATNAFDRSVRSDYIENTFQAFIYYRYAKEKSGELIQKKTAKDNTVNSLITLSEVYYPKNRQLLDTLYLVNISHALQKNDKLDSPIILTQQNLKTAELTNHKLKNSILIERTNLKEPILLVDCFDSSIS